MPAAPTTNARGVAARRQILDAAARLIARNGSRGTTLKQIAAATRPPLSQAGLLHHFNTKEVLLKAVLAHRAQAEDKLLWRNGPDPGLGIFDTIAELVAQWPNRPEVVGLVTVVVAENVGARDPLRQTLTEMYWLTIDRIRRTLEAAQARGEMRLDVDPAQTAIQILCFLSGLEMTWLIHSGGIAAAEIAKSWAAQQKGILAA